MPVYSHCETLKAGAATEAVIVEAGVGKSEFLKEEC
jgi:hypothetical protein